MALDLRHRRDGRALGHDDARPVAVGLALRVAERGHRLGVGDLVREHVAERAELADLELAVAHRLDLGVVGGGDEYLDLAAELVAEHLGDVIVDRHQLGGGVVTARPRSGLRRRSGNRWRSRPERPARPPASRRSHPPSRRPTAGSLSCFPPVNFWIERPPHVHRFDESARPHARCMLMADLLHGDDSFISAATGVRCACRGARPCLPSTPASPSLSPCKRADGDFFFYGRRRGAAR